MLPDPQRAALWASLRRRGLIPGPHESEPLFLRRVERSPAASLIAACGLAEFGMTPDWVAIKHDSEELRPWEGAATLIDEDSEGIPHADIHLGRSLFLTVPALLAHEMVHAVRCAFPETIMEEVMAWRTCPCKTLRWLSGLCLDIMQLVLAFFAIQTAVMGWILEQPLWWIGSSILLGLWALRAHCASAPLRRAIRHLARNKIPTWPILLHLTAEEIRQLERSPQRFWEDFAQAAHFRFEFMQATFAMLRTK